MSAGRKNALRIEIYGAKAGVAWDQERPDGLWIGQRNSNNQIILKNPTLLKPGARTYADLPGGHSEGHDDTFDRSSGAVTGPSKIPPRRLSTRSSRMDCAN